MPGEDQRRIPSRARYRAIYATLRAAISEGRLTPGVVLLEGPIAEAFGTSRIPVRQALKLLANDSLIRRFEGRGYLVGRPLGVPPEPLRLTISPELLGLGHLGDVVDQRLASERIILDMQHDITLARLFGHFRVNELETARHLNISRTVVREALMRLRDVGLVEKRPYGAWLTEIARGRWRVS